MPHVTMSHLPHTLFSCDISLQCFDFDREDKRTQVMVEFRVGFGYWISVWLEDEGWIIASG